MRADRFIWAALIGLSSASALAADLPPLPSVPDDIAPPFTAELRLGGSAQDPWGPESGSANIAGEAVFAKPFVTGHPVADLFIPRVHLGGSVNLDGATSFAYAGFTWTFDITSQVFVEAAFGGAFHDGNRSRDLARLGPDEAALGCSPLFREAGTLGYRLTPQWSVMATVEHLSNAGLCSRNRGLTNLGFKVGYTF